MLIILSLQHTTQSAILVQNGAPSLQFNVAVNHWLSYRVRRFSVFFAKEYSQSLTSASQNAKLFYLRLSQERAFEPASSTMADIHQNGIRATLSSIFNSGRYSDVTICSGGREFMVHRALICPRSRFFAAACDGEFQVHSI
jgi:hypothetical protein